MNYGPLIVLAAFFGLATSWFGFVLTPQMQVGHLQQTNVLAGNVTYPVARPGLARQGLDVYRANGCASCHSQQLLQTKTVCEVVLTDAGTNQGAVIQALFQLKPGLPGTKAGELLQALPQPLLENATRDAADNAMKILQPTGAKAELRIVPVGPDIARGWGKRRTVAEDFLYDYPAMPGSLRIGPDLASVGLRRDANWQLQHLYAPAHEVKGSVMPPYRFLFEKRRIERAPSPDALAMPPELAPEPGYEIVPKREARALVAYLLSLRSDAPLFNAPVTVPEPVPASSATNTPTAALNPPSTP
jgi:cbb3-type cytochrome oxidase cytochrome c subunit